MVSSDHSDLGGPNSEEVLGERTLLRAIDQTILEFNDDTQVQVVEGLFLDSVAELCRLYGLSGPAGFLVFMGNEFQPLCRSGEEATLGPVRKTPTLRSLIDQGPAASGRLVEFGEDQTFFESIGSAGACLVAPIYTGEHLLCVLVVTGDSQEQLQLIRQPHLRETIDDLAAQLTIAYRQFERARHHFEMSRLWDEFLGHNLSPLVCFKSLAERIPGFLPTFGPLGAVDPTPITQVLMLQKSGGDPPHEEHLVIRGTTGAEHSGTRIDVSNSISGILITRRDLPFFYGDPTAKAYERLYKNYFPEPEDRARTELAVRMMNDETCIGIINIESRHKDAFSLLQQRTLLNLADAFGRLAMVLEKRETMNTETQNSVATSTRNYLDALAKTYRHGIRTPLLSQATNAHLLKEEIGDFEQWIASAAVPTAPGGHGARAAKDIGKIIEQLRKTQSRMLRVHEEISRYSSDFIDDIFGYAVEAQMVLRDIVDSAVHLAYSCLLAGETLKIDVVSDASLKTTHIFCSTLIKQHLYSIFHNAVEATLERMKVDGRPGRIAVSIDEEKIPEGQEQRLNKGWIVRIRDNGAGVSKAQLAELNKFEPGITFKDGGSGYGLVAARGYVLSIGGRIELDAVEGEYFEVAIYFEEDMTEPHDEDRCAGGEEGLDGQAT